MTHHLVIVGTGQKAVYQRWMKLIHGDVQRGFVTPVETGHRSSSSLAVTMAEYSSLLSDLSENITNEDLEQLKSACKEDIPEDQSNNITSSKEWFSYLEKNDKLAQDNLSYLEHIFEISRRPDLLTRVIEYRTTVLKISEDDEIDTKLTRIPSAKKYKAIHNYD
ncbi:hypothetical protein F7725_004752 [Dissostichus mawsoni]|uniref:Astrocytic phosphoprotein PEA-15 n=1 Tax=Dissostichus mawsoni TaxID=36200 RepID=A0A7J5XMB0_DISMA|nr:hypothetical protein F7725_004752 [Dissostichus mawsoni]